MLIELSQTKNDPPYLFRDGIVYVIVSDEYQIIDTKRGKALKVKLNKRNAYDPIYTKNFEVSFTSEFMYIPMKYIISFKEGVSTINL